MAGDPIGDAPTRGVGKELLNESEWRAIARSLGLSERERQIVRRMFDDLKECAIADDLDISPHTVHTHLERLYHKLGVGSRCEVVVRVFAEYLALHDAGRLPCGRASNDSWSHATNRKPSAP